MSHWQDNFAWQAQYAPAVRQIVGPLLLSDAPLKLDQQEATDMMVLSARDMRIACRIRRPGFADRYPYEFTVRTRATNGGETEWRKLANGFGDWMFYGHASETEDGGIARWMIIDLSAWRAHHIRYSKHMSKITIQKSNGDGTEFAGYDVREFKPSPPILISSSFEFCPEPVQGDLLAMVTT